MVACTANKNSNSDNDNNNKQEDSLGGNNEADSNNTGCYMSLVHCADKKKVYKLEHKIARPCVASLVFFGFFFGFKALTAAYALEKNFPTEAFDSMPLLARCHRGTPSVSFAQSLAVPKGLQICI